MRTISRYGLCAAVLCLLAHVCAAEESAPIADNSFLIEEGYNQEAGVVQHISYFQYNNEDQSWEYTFTQEWPVVSQKHQFSYTVPLSHLTEPESESGLSDVLLNYRYQLSATNEVALAPRFSLLLPSGDEDKGLGSGALGYQINLPLSVKTGAQFVTHWNIGATLVPDQKDGVGNTASTSSFNYGVSVVYLAHPNFNLLLEAVGASEEVVVEGDSSIREDTFFLNPGARFAINFESGLQIVPGFSVPIGLGPSEGEWSISGYLSLEHPF